MFVIKLTYVNVVNPSPELMLALVQAQIVKKEGTRKGYYYKKGVRGPFRGNDGDSYYQVELAGKYYGHTAFGELQSIN